MAIEGDESIGETIQVAAIRGVGGERLVQHPRLGEPAHDDEPVGDVSLLPDRQSPGRADQRRDPAIDVRRQLPVDGDLGAACGFPAGEGRIVEEGETDRLLELVGVVSGEKHPGHVRLAGGHRPWARAVGGRTLEEIDFRRQAVDPLLFRGHEVSRVG